MPERVFQIVPPDEIYENTGVQFMQINTLFQLYALAQRDTRSCSRLARHFLTIPDLLNYWLTGKITCEYTNATTTQMFDARARDWASADAGAARHSDALSSACHRAGFGHRFLIGTGAPVIAPACHDTGSAVAAIEASGDTAFISSGTWSLMGTEAPAPIVTPQARAFNFTNEGGVGGTTRVLKNIMGMWLLQGCRKQWNATDYTSLVALAKPVPDLTSLVDPDDPSFLHPDDMTAAIDDFCRRTNQPVPSGQAGYVQTIFESLALKYRYVLESLAQLTGETYRTIRVVGGGGRNRVLNQYLADATNCRVLAGPVEATALGNLVMQMVGSGAVRFDCRRPRDCRPFFPARCLRAKRRGRMGHCIRPLSPNDLVGVLAHNNYGNRLIADFCLQYPLTFRSGGDSRFGCSVRFPKAQDRWVWRTRRLAALFH